MTFHDLRGQDFVDLKCKECKGESFRVGVSTIENFGSVIKARCTVCYAEYCLADAVIKE